MNAQEVYNQIIQAIKAHPDCRHVKCMIVNHSLRIIGKYKTIAEATYYEDDDDELYSSRYLDEYISDSINNVDADPRTYMREIINYIRAETRPDAECNALRIKEQFYKDNFPCLAAEIDYNFYLLNRQLVRDGGIKYALDGAGPIEQVCPELYHWDLLAFERKVHAALDGCPLPVPIRNEIFSLFAMFD